MPRELNEREREVLELIIQNFILTANPVGSRFLAKHSDLGLSDATIRNVMADLEEEGYITHPHTSAGRIPTDKGYRFYVNDMMRIGQLSQAERLKIDQNIDQLIADNTTQSDDILRVTSKILGQISKQIGIVLSPKLSTGIFEKLEIVPLSSSKVMVIISIRSGLVKTIMLEVRAEISRQKLEELSRALNERLSGLTLEQIRQTFAERVADYEDRSGLLRIFIESADKVFDEQPQTERVHISGKENLLSQPEFEQPEKMRGIIELIENEKVIVHLLEESVAPSDSSESVTIRIGKENLDSKMKECSIVTAQYSVGDAIGAVGVIGPTRMNYAKVVRVIDYIAKRLSQALSS
ncbi:MAG: heat-inducible transcriptional repressor HrcA [Chloroherpetonaceae bacterium]|nr:heat-inducible transcriptional repressor HrcA [Chloroherpetonaceae bacterium]MDW8437118.1 heat-inducible transcriptional repressor HrcA [Chloroherpetonaceae bacterium]